MVVRKCSFCKKSGHNITTCEERKLQKRRKFKCQYRINLVKILNELKIGIGTLVKSSNNLFYIVDMGDNFCKYKNFKTGAIVVDYFPYEVNKSLNPNTGSAPWSYFVVQNTETVHLPSIMYNQNWLEGKINNNF